MASLQDVNDKDRSKLLEAFGGDCRRIAKYRSVLEAISLSSKYASDQRLPSSLNAVNLIENLLREKSYGDKLKAVQDTIIPLKNPATDGDEADRRRKQQQAKAAEEARLAAEREAAEARAAAEHRAAERHGERLQSELAAQREAAERQAATQHELEERQAAEEAAAADRE